MEMQKSPVCGYGIVVSLSSYLMLLILFRAISEISHLGV
jgi:hypothetical protein